MRKMLAEALAAIAAEAAVNAIKELALGFAMLFLNPAEAAGHFASAALWGSIAGVAAVAGRGVAGDLFKQKNAANTSGAITPTGGGGSGSGSSTSGPTTINQDRNVSTLFVVFRNEPGAAFRGQVVETILEDVNSNGPLRVMVQDEAKGVR
jgi:hypothetical protein